MNKLLLCLLFTATSVVVSSQKVYFVYLQSESEQPFFVKMNEKIFSSSAAGYLILSKLVDSTYAFNLGFPQNKWPEQHFSVSINKKDHGYLVKNFGEKGWGLFDLQTLVVQMSSSGNAKVESPAENKDVSAFTDILSKAADDPSLREKPPQPKIEEKKPDMVVEETVKKEETKVATKELPESKPVEIIQPPVLKKEEPKAEVKELPSIKKEESKTEIKELPVVKREESKAEIKELPVVKKEESKAEVKDPGLAKPIEIVEQPVVKKEEPKTEIKEQTFVQIEETKVMPLEDYKKSFITKKSESSTTEGFGLVFIDDYENGVKDTIRLIIPNPKPIVSPVKEEPKQEKKFLDITAETPTKKDEKEEELKPVESKALAVKTGNKNNCGAVATESDFFKLRKKMAGMESDDNMISEAKKYFKLKCFTTAQVKNLGTMFLNDAAKYRFLDAAYACVSDVENFATLQSELKDEYYLNRFKAMLK